MKNIEITPEQARDYIARQHPDSLELPRNYNFGKTGNHMEASAVYVALIGHAVELKLLYGGLYSKSPGTQGERYNYSRAQCREFGRRQIDYAVREAQVRNAQELEEDPLEALQFQLANRWRLDDRPVNIYAVNSDGEVAKVSDMDGYVLPEDNA
jgi:hypothetical protein